MSREWPACDRALTEREREVLRAALALMPTGQHLGGGSWIALRTGRRLPPAAGADPEPFLKQLDSVRVLARCPCRDSRCESVRLSGWRKDSPTVCVAMDSLDRRSAMVHVDLETMQLALLEII
jgi:hypothetical protein